MCDCTASIAVWSGVSFLVVRSTFGAPRDADGHAILSWQAAKRLAEAEKSGASVVLALLRASVASKSIRVVELFNVLDTSKDGLISRWEAEAVAEGEVGRADGVLSFLEWTGYSSAQSRAASICCSGKKPCTQILKHDLLHRERPQTRTPPPTPNVHDLASCLYDEQPSNHMKVYCPPVGTDFAHEGKVWLQKNEKSIHPAHARGCVCVGGGLVCLDREELRAGLSVIAEGNLGQTSSVEQMREECKKRKRSAAIRDSQEKEQ